MFEHFLGLLMGNQYNNNCFIIILRYCTPTIFETSDQQSTHTLSNERQHLFRKVPQCSMVPPKRLNDSRRSQEGHLFFYETNNLKTCRHRLLGNIFHDFRGWYLSLIHFLHWTSGSIDTRIQKSQENYRKSYVFVFFCICLLIIC